MAARTPQETAIWLINDMVSLLLGAVLGFSLQPPVPGGAVASCSSSAPDALLRRAPVVDMKDWSKRKTLADVAGGLDDKGGSAVGLVGTIPVIFEQGNETRKTMALAGQPLSEVAAQAGQYIKYKCGKGECGTCEVRVDGQWIRTCSVQVPYVAPGEEYNVHVRPSMAKAKSSGRFFSFRSFIAGAKNNILGMVGFVKEGRASRARFQERIGAEEELAKLVAMRKAQKAKEEREAAKAAQKE